MSPRRRGEDGYALVAAVASIAVFALIALTIMAATRSALAGATADIDAARASAAADAGLVLAVHGLLGDVPWPIDGRNRTTTFDDARLTIRIEDERGKVPINRLDEEQVPKLLEAAGLTGERLRVASDSLLDWIDEDEDVRPDGAETDYYTAQHIRPRNGALTTIGELRYVRGFDIALVERLRPFITVDFGQGGFVARHARPQAIGVMLGGGEDSPEAIVRARELAGQRTAIDLEPVDPADLIGRPLTVTVDAALPSGARRRRIAVIELTGDVARPWIVRASD